MSDIEAKSVFFESCKAQVAANNQANQESREPLTERACGLIYDTLVGTGYSNNDIMRGIQKVLFFFKEDTVETLIKRFVLKDDEVYDEENLSYDDLFDCEAINVIALQQEGFDDSEGKIIYNLNYFELKE